MASTAKAASLDAPGADVPAAAPVDHPHGLHPRLAADCHLLGRLDRALVLLHRNALVGWLILVPDTEAEGWHELDDAEHDHISRQIREVSVQAADLFAADRMNVASIGNEVPQMHIHIVARHVDDACWPKPVWGHLPGGPAYEESRVAAIRDDLAATLGLQPADAGHA